MRLGFRVMNLPGGGALAKTFTATVNKVVELRYEPALQNVQRLRAKRIDGTPSEIADAVIRRYRKELSTVGAASGGVAAIPGVGTEIGVAATVSESGWVATRLGQMILEIGITYGHDAESIEERRAWVLAVLSSAFGIAEGLGTWRV